MLSPEQLQDIARRSAQAHDGHTCIHVNDLAQHVRDVPILLAEVEQLQSRVARQEQALDAFRAAQR